MQPRATINREAAPADPDTAHPRTVEMAEAMREGATTFRALVEHGFTPDEIGRLHEKACALAASLSELQIGSSPDLLTGLLEKAAAANIDHMPAPKGARQTQAMTIAWGRYCMARQAYRLDPWDGQHTRCIALLQAFFHQTPLGPAVTRYIIDEALKTMRAQH